MFDLTTLDEMLVNANCAAAGKLHWYPEVESTSDVIADLEDFHGAVCLAGVQTRGRGRRGQQWRAPFGSSVLMSVGWRLDRVQPGGLSLACGLAVDRALRASGVDLVSLKWPNDILLGERKLGGILVELNGQCCTVGLGLNIRIHTGALATRDAQHPGRTRIPWTDLYGMGYEVDLTRLAAALIVSICAVLQEFGRSGFAVFRQAWQDRHRFQGERVCLTGPNQNHEGLVCGVDEIGGLQIEVDGERRVFYAGDVSLVPANRSAVT